MLHFVEYVLRSLDKRPSKTLLKLFSGTAEEPAWTSVTYKTFREDIERAGGYWQETLEDLGLQEQDVVALWLTGDKYHDLVLIYAIARVGYIPQILNKTLASASPAVILDILATTGAQTLLFDPLFSPEIDKIPFTCLEVPELSNIPQLTEDLQELPEVDEDEIGIIFQNSRTISGKTEVKPEPKTHEWLTSQAQIQWPQLPQGRTSQTVLNISDFSSLESATSLMHLASSGQTLIQTSRPNFDTHELLGMVPEGLNFLTIDCHQLSKLISVARRDKEVFGALQTLSQISYTGSCLVAEDDLWLMNNHVRATILWAKVKPEPNDDE